MILLLLSTKDFLVETDHAKRLACRSIELDFIALVVSG